MSDPAALCYGCGHARNLERLAHPGELAFEIRHRGHLETTGFRMPYKKRPPSPRKYCR